jgi:uncharacterized membrane protein YiaA
MAEVLEKMIAADVIVMATPVFFYTMCGQMKTLIDRTCSRYTEIRNKEFYFIVRVTLWVIAVLAVTASGELLLGRLPFGPDGKFGWWEGNIWSSEQSQRFADPYSFSHIVHGLMFYALLWLACRGLPARHRFLIAVILESIWEVMENSPFVINRYRTVTISLGYVGDSVLNSLSDVLMMSLGFWAALYCRVRTCVALVFAIEIGMLLWYRDNLTLNIIMLVHPVEAIKNWQLAGRPGL